MVGNLRSKYSLTSSFKISAVAILLWCAGFSLFSLTTSFAQESQENNWRHAGDLIQSGDYASALKELDRLLSERPEDVTLLRLKGICLLQLGEVDGAISILQQALKKDSTSIACRYYLAQAFATRGSISLAIDLLRGVQKNAPESLYAQQAASILPELENLAVTGQALSDKRRWNLSLRSGTEYDDNVLNRSRHDDGDPGSWRLLMASYFEFRPIDQEIDSKPFTLGAGYGVYSSFHTREKFNDFNLLAQTARLFISHASQLKSVPYKAQLSGDYAYNRLGNHPYSHEAGVGTDLDVQWAPWATFSPTYSIHWKNVSDDTDIPELFSRDGHEQVLGVRQRFFTFKNKVIFDIYYNFRWTSAEGSQFDKQRSNEVGGATHLNLPWKIRFSTGVSYQNENYIRFAPSPPDRVENEVTTYATLSRPLWANGLTLETTYSHNTAESGADFADLHRNVYGISLSYSI